MIDITLLRSTRDKAKMFSWADSNNGSELARYSSVGVYLVARVYSTGNICTTWSYTRRRRHRTNYTTSITSARWQDARCLRVRKGQKCLATTLVGEEWSDLQYSPTRERKHSNPTAHKLRTASKGEGIVSQTKIILFKYSHAIINELLWINNRWSK